MMLYDVLKTSKWLYVNDSFAMLWGKQLGGWNVTELTGTLPITFRADGSALINYRIYGTAEGAGVQTVNLIDITGFNSMLYGVRWYEDNGQLKASGTYTDNAAHTQPRFYIELNAGTYTVSGSLNSEQSGVYLQVGTCTDERGSNFSSLGSDTGTGYTFMLQEGSWVGIRVVTTASLYQQTVDLTMPLMLRRADTSPDFEPFGYRIPLTLKSGAESKTANVYIGDSKLMAGDYIDYESGKIVRNGTPQDPPKPFPEIDTYIGINALDSVETLGEVTIKGKIKEA